MSRVGEKARFVASSHRTPGRRSTKLLFFDGVVHYRMSSPGGVHWHNRASGRWRCSFTWTTSTSCNHRVVTDIKGVITSIEGEHNHELPPASRDSSFTESGCGTLEPRSQSPVSENLLRQIGDALAVVSDAEPICLSEFPVNSHFSELDDIDGRPTASASNADGAYEPFERVPALPSHFDLSNKGIGSGGFGNVFVGFLHAAFKRVSVAGDDGLLDRTKFECTKDEIVLLKNLEHPNIIHLYDAKFVEPEQTFYLAMEQMDGSVKNLGVLTEGQACVVLREIGKALAYLHAAYIGHLDVKSENVLVKRGASPCSPPQVKLIDFNLSTKLDDDGFTRRRVGGTAWCMAPESARRYRSARDELISSTADVWSFLILLFEITHGYWPNGDLTSDEVIAAICKSEDYAAEAKSQFVADHAPNLKQIFFDYLHSDPSWRFPIDAMLNDCVILHSHELSVLDEAIQRMFA